MRTTGVREKKERLLTVVDSSGWIEYFTDGPLARRYATHPRDLSEVSPQLSCIFHRLDCACM